MRRKSAVAAALVAAVVIIGACATVAPGEDKLVVRTQQALSVSTPIYDRAMDWSRANARLFSPSGLAIVNKVRIEFPLAYKAVDDALDLYKAGKEGPEALQAALGKINDLIDQITALVLAAGGPDMRPPPPGTPAPAPGGAK